MVGVHIRSISAVYRIIEVAQYRFMFDGWSICCSNKFVILLRDYAFSKRCHLLWCSSVLWSTIDALWDYQFLAEELFPFYIICTMSIGSTCVNPFNLAMTLTLMELAKAQYRIVLFPLLYPTGNKFSNWFCLPWFYGNCLAPGYGKEMEQGCVRRCPRTSSWKWVFSVLQLVHCCFSCKRVVYNVVSEVQEINGDGTHYQESLGVPSGRDAKFCVSFWFSFFLRKVSDVCSLNVWSAIVWRRNSKFFIKSFSVKLKHLVE